VTYANIRIHWCHPWFKILSQSAVSSRKFSVPRKGSNVSLLLFPFPFGKAFTPFTFQNRKNGVTNPNTPPPSAPMIGGNMPLHEIVPAASLWAGHQASA
jgi:hypothetical protein